LAQGWSSLCEFSLLKVNDAKLGMNFGGSRVQLPQLLVSLFCLGIPFLSQRFFPFLEVPLKQTGVRLLSQKVGTGQT
jgi:hypothetical protein